MSSPDYVEFYQDTYTSIESTTSAIHVDKALYENQALHNPCGFTLSVTVSTVTHDILASQTDAFDALAPTTSYTCSDGSAPPTTPFTTHLIDLRDASGAIYADSQQVIDYQGRFVFASDPIHAGTYTVNYRIGFHQESFTELTEVGSY